MFKRLIIALAMILGLTAAHAAPTLVKKTVLENITIATYRFVNPKCTPGAYDVVYIEGEFHDKRIVDSVKSHVKTAVTCKEEWPVKVYLNSNGGQLDIGAGLGLFFRDEEVHTIVAGKDLCASSCAFAFLGGKWREMADDARMMLHAPYEVVDGKKVCSYDADFENWLETYLIYMVGDQSGVRVYERVMYSCFGQFRIDKKVAEEFGITTKW